MEKENWLWPQDNNTRASFKMIKNMVKELWFSLLLKSMMDNGLRTKCKVKVKWIGKIKSIKENGKIINPMDLVANFGLKSQEMINIWEIGNFFYKDIKVFLKMEWGMELELFFMPMALNMKDFSMKI